MSNRMEIIPALINVLIIFAVFRFLTKLKRKKTQSNDNNHSKNIPTPTKSIKTQTQPQAKNLKHEATAPDLNSLNLKRCPNCGGEIPLSMMKCEICGHRQPGCGATFIIFAIIMILFIAFLFINGYGLSIDGIISSAIDWLREL